MTRKIHSSHVRHDRNGLPQDTQKGLSSKAAGESKPEAYPLGRTVRRIRSTEPVRAAEW